MKYLITLILIILLIPSLVLTQTIPDDKMIRKIERLDYKNTDIRDVVRSLATKYDLNIIVENNLDLRITLHLIDVTVKDVLDFIVKDNNLGMEQTGSIFKIFRPPVPQIPPREILVSLVNNRITADFQNDEIDKVIRSVVNNSSKTILLEQGTSGTINGILNNTDFDEGFKELLKNNGFILEKRGDIYTVKRDFYSFDQQGGAQGQMNNRRSSFFLNVQDSLISIEVRETPIEQIVQEAASRLKKNIFIYGKIDGTISARAEKLHFVQLLDLLFQGSEYTYKVSDGIILIGNKSVKGITSAELIRLNFLKADHIAELLPQSIQSKIELKAIIEQNGIMVIGPRSVINDVQSYINSIDRPSPQILIEALVIDINNTKARELGIEAQRGGSADTSGISAPNLLLPGIDAVIHSGYLNKQIEGLGKIFGISNIGKLPDDFDVRIKALETNGVAQVRSRPQIATLNGYPADISVGQTEYYKLTTSTPLRDPTQIYISESQRFETIEANISLQILPWVSSSGEITVEIHPKFQIPGERVSLDIPPTIQTRELNSTVRLKDGETIILGGLIQTTDTENITGIPFLSSIPGLGSLFTSQNFVKSKNELIIYVTPHLYYGDE
jgi:type IV pilus assembly protein PilQ